MIGGAVGELSHHPHVWIGLCAVLLNLAQVVVAAVIPVGAHAVVNITPLGLNTRGAQKLDLLGLAVANGDRLWQRIKMVVFEGLLLDLRWRSQSVDSAADAPHKIGPMSAAALC